LLLRRQRLCLLDRNRLLKANLYSYLSRV
jgi:hypothetical protein